MTVKYIGEGAINNGLFSKLLASYTHSPTYYADSAITVNTTANTLTVTGYTPNAGDAIVFWITANTTSNTLPTPLTPCYTYYVQNVSGSSFQVASANNTSSIVTITGTGTTGKWRMERQSGINSITINNLPNIHQVRIVLKNGGWNTTYGSVNFQFNGVTDSDSYWYNQISSSGVNAQMYLYYTNNYCTYRFGGVFDIACNSTALNATAGITGMYFTNAATGATNNSYYGSGYGISKEDSRFGSLNTIKFFIGNGSFVGNLTMEVYGI